MLQEQILNKAKIPVGTKVDVFTCQRVTERAQQTGVTISEYLRRLIQADLDRLGGEKGRAK